MKKIIAIVFVSAIIFASNNVFAITVTTQSTDSGIYENGEFVPTNDVFIAKYDINENRKTITLAQIVESTREGKFSVGNTYDITNNVVSKGFSALTVSMVKKDQDIFTGVRESGLGSSEILIIGADFYEYCRAYDGRFYLEHGRVVRIVK